MGGKVPGPTGSKTTPAGSTVTPSDYPYEAQEELGASTAQEPTGLFASEIARARWRRKTKPHSNEFGQWSSFRGCSTL